MFSYWLTLALVVIANTTALAGMWLIQKWMKRSGRIPARHSLIPESTQKFLYFEDFRTQLWGDSLGLPFVGAAFVWLIINSQANAYQIGLALILGVEATSLFSYQCLSWRHKPDWGYPDIGEISWGGGAHLVYFFFYIVASSAVLWSIINGTLSGLPMWLALAGGGFYIATYVADLRAGVFDRRQWRMQKNTTLTVGDDNKKGGVMAL